MLWIALAAAAGAGPVYLECSITGGTGQVLAAEMVADEANQRLTVALPSTGYTVVLPARFSPSAVEAYDEPLTWRIDRQTLSVTRQWRPTDKPEVGKCRVLPAPAKRAF